MAGKYFSRESWGILRIDDDMWMTAFSTVHIWNDPDIQFDVDIVVKYAPEFDRSIAESVNVMRRPGGPEVTGTALRTIRVQEYLQKRERVLMDVEGPEAYPARHGVEPQQGQRGQDFSIGSIEDWIGDDKADPERWKTLRPLWAYRVYKWAGVCNLNPVQEVQSLLGVSGRTASRLIATAREQGLFEKWSPLKIRDGAKAPSDQAARERYLEELSRASAERVEEDDAAG